MSVHGFEATLHHEFIAPGFLMPRLLLLVAVLVGLAAGGLGMYVVRPASGLDEAAVRAVVAGVLAERDAEAPVLAQSAPAMDVAVIGPVIDDYLMSNPSLLQRMSDKLDTQQREAQAVATRAAISEHRADLFDGAGNIVIGNPDGDVTLVELFDYNCSYCRNALPDLATLIAEDPNLRIVLKEFPILSQDSVDAARVGVLVSREPVDYWDFHQKLFSSRGKVTGQAALDVARDLGLNPVALQLDMQSTSVAAVIQKSYDIATSLKITGTPTYIIGDEMIPGAIPIADLRARIANMRACGKTRCDGAS